MLGEGEVGKKEAITTPEPGRMSSEGTIMAPSDGCGSGGGPTWLERMDLRTALLLSKCPLRADREDFLKGKEKSKSRVQ